MKFQDFSYKIFIVFDNICANNGYLTDFGFSALIFNKFTQNYLLFDTGDNSDTLIHNINKSDINVLKINKIIISHNHFDHAGGLSGLLKINPKIETFVPYDNREYFKRSFQGSKFHGILEFVEIEKNIYSSGQLGTRIKEQALYLKTRDEQIVIIVGCTHPGLENYILKAQEMGDIKAIIGGFHGFNKYSYLDGIDIISPCHCSIHIDEIQKRYPNQFRKMCVGDSFTV